MMKIKMRAFCWFLSLFCAIRTEGFAVRGPAMPLVVQLGASVTLPCSVDTPLPLHKLEVQWMREDSRSMLHLFQEGKSWPGSQSPAYSGRADFFSEEISKGNFSLLLRNVTSEDKGLYKCVVHTVHESNETKVKIDIDRLVVTGADMPAYAYAGEDVILNCLVDTHVPLKELQVEWMKTDGEILVLVFSDGENRPESQHERFRGRAEFFSEEIPKGNFSLKLRDVKTEDEGEFMCKVHTDRESVSATVWLRELGFFSLHMWVLGLTIAAVVLIFCIPALLFIIEDDESKSSLLLFCHVTVPCILISIAFAIWGYIEGSVGEAFVGSAIHFTRILLLFWVSQEELHDTPFEIFTYMALPLDNFVITTGINSVVLQTFLIYRAPDSVAKILTGILFGIGLLSSFSSLVIHSVSMGRYKKVKILCQTITILVEIAFLIFTHGSRYSSSELPALMCFMAFHFILHAASLFRLRLHLPGVPNYLIYIFGSAVLSVINSVALAIKVILKAGKGEQTVDLRLIVFPLEFFFLAFWPVLQKCSFTVWLQKKEEARQMKELEHIRLRFLQNQTPQELQEMVHLSPPEQSTAHRQGTDDSPSDT